MRNRAALETALREARDSKEDFYLQGGRLKFMVSERDLEPDPYLADKLQLLPSGGNFNNVEFLTALFSAYDITVLTSEDLDNQLTENVKILLERIHSSQSGKIFTEDLAFSTREIRADPFEIKGSQEGALLHEIFVSFFVTNRLRKLIPNFQLCYAGLQLTPKIDYLLLERLQGQSLTMMLRTCSLEQYLSWYLQVILALEFGVVHSGFTHNNLNPDNIQIVPANADVSKIKIRYFHHNEFWILETTEIAVLRNFELSHVKHKYDRVIHSSSSSGNQDVEIQETMVVNQSEHFGPIGLEEYGLFYNETRPFFDLYRFLMWSLRLTQKFNPTVFSQIRRLASYFGLEDGALESTLDREEKLGYIYSVSVSNLERTRSLREVLAFAVREFPNELSEMLRKQSSYSSLQIMDCSRFCVLDGYKLVEPVNRFTDGWGLREIMERLNGLKKRTQELKRLAQLTCALSGRDEGEEDDRKLCLTSSEEAIEAQTEYQLFLGSVRDQKDALHARAVLEIEGLQAFINEKIRIANIDIDGLKLEVATLNSKDEELLKRLFRRRAVVVRSVEAVKGKVVTLVGLVSQLTIFLQKFKPSENIPQFSISGIHALD